MFKIAEIKDQILQLGDVIAAVVLRHQNPVDDEISERKAKKEFGAGWIGYHEARDNIQWSRRGASRNSPKVTSRAGLLALRKAEDMAGEEIKREFCE